MRARGTGTVVGGAAGAAAARRRRAAVRPCAGSGGGLGAGQPWRRSRRCRRSYARVKRLTASRAAAGLLLLLGGIAMWSRCHRFATGHLARPSRHAPVPRAGRVLRHRCAAGRVRRREDLLAGAHARYRRCAVEPAGCFRHAEFHGRRHLLAAGVRAHRHHQRVFRPARRAAGLVAGRGLHLLGLPLRPTSPSRWRRRRSGWMRMPRSACRTSSGPMR